jgi:uncharacterized protein (TIGR03083 family)
MDLTSNELLEVAFDAVQAGGVDLPAGMAARVFAVAIGEAKPIMHPAWAGPYVGLSPHAAFVQTAAELGDLLDSLEADDWARPTRVSDRTVHDMAVHLAGVERYVLGQLGLRERLAAPTREDHVPVSRRAASDLVGAPGEAVARAWWLEVLKVIAACAQAAPDDTLEYHHLPGSVQGLLIVRTFELWTHGDDIRDAIGRGLDPLDAPRLSLMATQLMRVLPLGMAMSGCARPGRTARIHVTGPGGGTFLVPLSPGDVPGDPDVILSASTLDLCRVAARRLSTDEFELGVEGTRELVEPILVGATAFAAD